jgi:3-methyl-2-oxobutanoate hydroxymethyltransferase
MKQRGEKFTCLTAYDASFALLQERAGIEVILVGDSLGMVIKGQQSTLPVSMDEMVYHTANVSRVCQQVLIMADLPFAADVTKQQALSNCARLMAEGGAHMVKIEGGSSRLETIRFLAQRGIPVCSHLGLLPQSVFKYGGYKVQGRTEESAAEILQDAADLEQAGADILLLECVPATLAAKVTRKAGIPVIGIGAGGDCDAQVLVSYDMLGITQGTAPRFVKNFLAETVSIQKAVELYVSQVKQGVFPSAEHEFE